MEARYAYFGPVRSIFLSMADINNFYARFPQRASGCGTRCVLDARELRNCRAPAAGDALPSVLAGASMTLRAAKLALVFAVALYYTLQEVATRKFTAIGIVLLPVVQPNSEEQL
jgi:hypothetical protein